MKADTDMNKLPCEDTLGVHEPPCSGALRNMFLVFGFWFLGLCVRKFGYEVVAVVLCVSDCYMYNKIFCFYFSPCENGSVYIYTPYR